MAIKKTKLYASLWASCDVLCSGVNVSRYKDSVLRLLFARCVSKKYKSLIDIADFIVVELAWVTQQLPNQVRPRELSV